VTQRNRPNFERVAVMSTAITMHPRRSGANCMVAPLVSENKQERPPPVAVSNQENSGPIHFVCIALGIVGPISIRCWPNSKPSQIMRSALLPMPHFFLEMPPNGSTLASGKSFDLDKFFTISSGSRSLI